MTPKCSSPDSKKAAVKVVNDRVPTTNVVEYFDVTVRTIQCYLRISKARGIVETPPGSGRPKITTPTKDRIIVRLTC